MLSDQCYSHTTLAWPLPTMPQIFTTQERPRESVLNKVTGTMRLRLRSRSPIISTGVVTMKLWGRSMRIFERMLVTTRQELLRMMEMAHGMGPYHPSSISLAMEQLTGALTRVTTPFTTGTAFWK